MQVNTFYISLMCLIFVFLSQEILAQPVYKALVPGQLITKDGKIRKGKIMVQSYEEHSQQLIFFDQIYIKTVYEPAEVESYSLHFVRKGEDGKFIKEWRHFESKIAEPFEGIVENTVTEFAFFERLVEGHLRLYRKFLSAEDDRNPQYVLYVETVDFQMVEINTVNFKKKAKEVFNQYPEMTEAIGMDGYSYEDMDWMVENYNVWLSRK